MEQRAEYKVNAEPWQRVLPSVDTTHLGHLQTAPLPVLQSTMRIKLDNTIDYYSSNSTRKVGRFRLANSNSMHTAHFITRREI